MKMMTWCFLLFINIFLCMDINDYKNLWNRQSREVFIFQYFMPLKIQRNFHNACQWQIINLLFFCANFTAIARMIVIRSKIKIVGLVNIWAITPTKSWICIHKSTIQKCQRCKAISRTTTADSIKLMIS